MAYNQKNTEQLEVKLEINHPHSKSLHRNTHHFDKFRRCVWKNCTKENDI